MKTTRILFLFLSLLSSLYTSGQTINMYCVGDDRQALGDNGYTLNGARMAIARTKLLNPENFSDTGTYKKNIIIHSAFTEAGSLENISEYDDIDIFFIGSFQKEEPSFTNFTEAEIDSLYEWSRRGGKIIIAEQPNFDNFQMENIGPRWGHSITHSDLTGIWPNELGKSTAIFNGPFGEVTRVLEGGFNQGFFSTINSNSLVLATNGNGSSTVILDCNTLDLIFPDTDIFTDLSPMSLGKEIINDQDRILANTIIFIDILNPIPPVIDFDGSQIGVGEYNSYKWLYNWDSIPVSVDSVTTPLLDGYYRVIVEQSYGCKDTSDVFVYGSQEEPLISCPEDLILFTDPGKKYSSARLSLPNVLDDDGTPSITRNGPATFPMGNTTITWSISDVDGYHSSCEQEITVIDNENPTMIPLSSIVIYTDEGVNYSSFDLPIPNATDNDTIISITNDAPDVLPIGLITVVWTATDNSGNSVHILQGVRVIDAENPVITCPENLSIGTDVGENYASVIPGFVVASDNDSVTISNNAPAVFLIGSTTVTWVAVDRSRNTATCEQSVVVNDFEPPLIECPPEINTLTDEGMDVATITSNSPVATDNSGEVFVSNDASNTFPAGTSTVIWTARDASGNDVTCEQTIAVIDFENFSVPNIITPNGDDLNDMLIIDNLPSNSELIIFDRANKIIFNTDDYQNDWGGLDLQNRPVESGTYWYMLRTVYDREFSGFLILNRK